MQTDQSEIDKIYDFILEREPIDQQPVLKFQSVEHTLEWLLSDVVQINNVHTPMPDSTDPSNDSIPNNFWPTFNESNRNQRAFRHDYDDESEYIDVVGLPAKDTTSDSNTTRNWPNSTIQTCIAYDKSNSDHIYHSRQMIEPTVLQKPDENSKSKIQKKGKTYQCDKCATFVNDKRSLNRHMKKHKEPVTFECSKCPRKYMKKCYLVRHEKRHLSASLSPLKAAKIIDNFNNVEDEI